MRSIATLADIPVGAWCILRCRGQTTVRLAESLSEDGFEAWTPRETRKIRVPRMNVRRDVVLPLLPSYVFAKASHLVDLLELAAKEIKVRRGCQLEGSHANFSVMQCFGKLPLVADNDLNRLRELEIKLTPRKKAERSFDAGAEVRVDGGSFGGMTGCVKRSDRGHTLVCFNEKYTVKISTSLLLSSKLGVPLPYEGDAAREAA